MEILSRATSITEALDETSKGAKFFKVRQKGGFRGLKLYCRTFKTDFNEFSITYLPNKAITGKANCVGHPGPGNPASIDIRDISEVRIGHSTDTFNALVKQNNNKSSPKIGDVLCHRDNCFSIIFNDDTPNLDLIAETTSIRNTWANVIQHLIVAMKSLDEEKKFKLFLKRQFKNADKDGSGCLSFDECQDLISQLNIKFPADKVKALFNEADFLENQDKGTLCEEEFIRFSYNLLNRPELRPVFLKYCIGSSSDGNARMTVEHLCQFMKEEQKYDICREEGKQLIEAFEPSADKSSLSLDGFSHFIMFSDLHHILNSQTKLVYQDMSQPMSHYWIASSHNTYLLGNQISGESSVDGYIRSLKEGCRCVELDCWDGSDGEPIIYHGWTLTTKILFKDVIKDAIAKYAFAASDFPLILSIENHCSLEQQDKMADYMRDLLGDYLFTSPPDEEASVMPSPDSLKKKILVKAKRLPPGKSPDDELVDEDSNDDEVDEKRKEKAKKISQKLSDCVNYIHAVHFPGFESEDGAEKSKYYHMSSFGENKTMSILAEADSATKFVHYNTRQISRIYPGAARQDSSNLKILPPWNAGCQIVALNYQTEDKQNFINASKFADNGKSGYILKPNFLRDPSISYSPLSPSGLADQSSIQLKIRVISGLQLPKPGGAVEGEVIDPYVKLRIRGHPDDEVDSDGEKINKGKTEAVKNNGFNPVWNQEFEFKIQIPALAFLDIKVKDLSQSGTDNDLGMFCCPLLTIQEGYRRVPLKSYARNQDLHPAALLLHIQVNHQ